MVFLFTVKSRFKIATFRSETQDGENGMTLAAITGDLHESDMHSDLYLRWLSETENAARKTQLPLKAMGTAFSANR